MKRLLIVVMALGVCARSTDSVAEEFVVDSANRTWTSADGNFTLDALLVGSDADEVTLRRSNGTQLRVKKYRLSGLDQTYISGRTHRASKLARTHPVSLVAKTEKSIASPARVSLSSLYRMEVKPTRRVKATLDYCIDAPNYKIQKWIVFLPGLPSLPQQQGVVTRTDLPAQIVHERHGLRRPVLRAVIDHDCQLEQNRLSFAIEYTAQLHSRNLVRQKNATSPADIPSLSEQDAKLYCAASSRINFRAIEVKRWMDRHRMWREKDENDIDFAWRVYQSVWHSMDYVYRERQYRRASQVCAEGVSDCGGLSALIVATLRANKVPARLLVGRWAASAEGGERLGGEIYRKQHIVSEFFVDGIGWIPMDIASGITRDRKNFGRRYFGREDGEFLAMHVDSDIQLDTIYFGLKRINALQSPAFWAKGVGNLDNATVEEGWKVTEIDP